MNKKRKWRKKDKKINNKNKEKTKYKTKDQFVHVVLVERHTLCLLMCLFIVLTLQRLNLRFFRFYFISEFTNKIETFLLLSIS